MDLHDRYLRFPTLDISVLRAANDNLEDDTSVVPHHLMQFYNCEITKEQLNMSKLEIYRMLLSYEYQQVFGEIERRNNKKYIPSDVRKICFSNIEAVFPAQHLRSVAEMSILRDIIILQTVLYCNIISIKEHLQNFLNSYNVYTTHKDTRAMYMKVLEYFLESLRLHQFSLEDGSGDEKESKEICSIYLNIIKSWMKTKEDSEWGVFASMLPLLVKTFAPEHVLFPLWNCVMNEVNNLKEFFTILSIMVDTCFTSSYCIKFTCIHNDIFSKNIFWLTLLDGLQSPSQQSRKQALYVIRRATDFLSKTDNLHLEFTKAEITPFICSKSSDSALPADSIKQKFFLLYEALEEKQYHLVVPALTHLTSLVKATKEHESCQCFHIVWLRCILEKVLRHENNNIVKWGVSYVCKLDAIVFDHIHFLELFVNILNNSFLYECQPNEDCPEIVKELATLFRCMAKGETSLLNAFLKRVSEVTWGPVAIFYVVHTLRITSQEMAQRGSWRAAELNAVKSLAETSLSVHSHVLRAASRIELLQTIPNFVRKIDDLTLVANVLAAFPRGEDFTGRNFPWNVITTWLREVLAKEDAVMFVEQTCAKFSRENLVPEVSPRTFALMVYLLYDARLVLSCKTCPTYGALNNWLSSTNGIETRPYADIRSSVDIAEFISHSLNIFAQTQSWNSLMRLILLHVRPSFMFFGKNVKRMAMGLTYEDYTRYTAVLSSYVENAKLIMPERDAISCLDTLLSEAVRLLRNTPRRSSMQYLYGMRILNFSWNKCNVTSFYEENFLNVRAMQADADTLKGKIASELYLLLSRLMSDYLTSISTWGSVPIATLLTQLLKFLELGGAEIVVEVTTVLTTILAAVGLEAVAIDTSDKEILEHVLQSCWRCTFAGKKNNVFWTAIRNLTGVIVNNNFFLLPGAMEFIAEFTDRLIQEGDGASRFKRILLSKMERLEVPSLMKLEKALFNCLLHGSTLRRDERVENRVHLFIAKHLGQYFPKHIVTADYNNDATVRAHATTLLHRIICRPDVNYATAVAPLIFETLEKYRNKRYFNDSYIHKLKHRLMQILLILEPVMSKELVILVLQKLQDAIISESNQHSVRLMQEWLMTRILMRYSDLHDRLWKFFAESIEKRPGCAVSVASIVYHIARLLSADSRKNFIRTALSYVAKCCLGQQFNVRLYNQFIMIRLCELMKEASGDIFFYTGMYEASLAGLQQATSTKKIQDDFYFSSFHPIDDYSLQTIYFELPRLTNVSCDEWIRPNVFEAFTFEQSANHPLKLYNVNSSLPNTTASMYLTESLAGDSLASNVETYSEGLQNIQRKLDPSKFTVPLSGDNFGAIEASQDLAEEGLIVVASLVNRPPNLGGIARTCEIFGVRSLVIANLACVKDKEFQCLSVSAERWINMLQVKPHELQQYLLDKKNAGWSLIGAEQTANSVNLLEAKFEKKTIFVLGNEKDGIPANLIPLFNTCVEIPQAGVIRSLNVHVTAAICIWQYASQYTLK